MRRSKLTVGSVIARLGSGTNKENQAEQEHPSVCLCFRTVREVWLTSSRSCFPMWWSILTYKPFTWLLLWGISSQRGEKYPMRCSKELLELSGLLVLIPESSQWWNCNWFIQSGLCSRHYFACVLSRSLFHSTELHTNPPVITEYQIPVLHDHLSPRMEACLCD